MRIISKKKIVVLIILIIIMIIQIKAFIDSSANNLIEIAANIVDNSGLLNDETYNLQAINEKESGYCITLPNIVNQKKIKKYLIESKNILESQNEIGNEENNKIKEILPGEKVYLTKDELENKQIKLNAEYELKQKNDKYLYNQVVEKQIDNQKIMILGFMPKESQVKIEKADIQRIEKIAKESVNDKITVKVAYDIKIIADEKEYEPLAFEEKIDVSIRDIDIENSNNEKYGIIHIDDENNVEEIQNIEIKENQVTFKADEFSTYAVVSQSIDEDVTNEISEGPVMYKSKVAVIKTGSKWDGKTIATQFTWGSGDEQEPYLISDGAELAYLARRSYKRNNI